MHFVKFETARIQDCINFIQAKGLHRCWLRDGSSREVRVKATGGGAIRFSGGRSTAEKVCLISYHCRFCCCCCCCWQGHRGRRHPLRRCAAGAANMRLCAVILLLLLLLQSAVLCCVACFVHSQLLVLSLVCLF
jgi:hypothetical protein